MLDNIPNEMRLLNQWVVAGPDKNPINARTGEAASVTDPRTWSSFEEARRTGYRHVGFVLSADDPYAIIDLDEPLDAQQAERHRRIYNAFDSYTELSQSGKGVHIIVRGSIPSGVRRDKVEVYSSARYMICTGNVLNNAPITDHQPLLEAMHREMASTVVAELEEREASMTDERIFEVATNAVNGEKFTRLCNGDMTGYPSQSEADFALLTILSFYSKSNEQVRRLFRYSALGKRDKAQRNDAYLDRALAKIRGKQAPALVDMSGLIESPMLPGLTVTETTDVEVPTFTPPPPPPAQNVIVPPGLIGEMCSYIYSSAIRPVWEVSLAAAIALGAGILGRHYNISNTGLNQYLILLAQTGTGKEGAAGGIDALLGSIRAQVPACEAYIGPGTFASGQALVRVLDKSPCFVSVLGEVGLLLQQVCDKHAGAHLLQLRRALLDVFAKSGWNKWLRPSVYSDTDKNTQSVRAPNITILGESTPQNFYGALDGHHISEGLVPRFMVIEYTGPRPPINAKAFHHPDAGLSHRLMTAVQTVLTMQSNDTCVPVQMDRWAAEAMSAFNCYADDMINESHDDVNKQLWNRAHIKALKLGALVSVGCSVHQPVVTKDVADWAINLVTRDVVNMSTKFASGEIGHGDHEQEADIRAACDRYPALTEKQRADYKVPKLLLGQGKLIPYVYLKRYLSLRASFKNDRRGAVVALTIALNDMVKAGTLSQIPQEQAKKELGVDSPVYYRGESF